MDWKRHYFKLEMEQLPEHIWTGFKSSEVVREMKVREKSEIIQQIERSLLSHALIECGRRSNWFGGNPIAFLMAEKLEDFAPSEAVSSQRSALSNQL